MGVTGEFQDQPIFWATCSMLLALAFLALPAAGLVAPPKRPAFARAPARALAPSGVDGLPDAAQALVFAGCFAGLGVGTAATTALLERARAALGRTGAGAEAYRRAVEALPLLGALYVLAGAGHFAAADAFEAIYPPPGTWGIWYLPGSAAFHVAWTGAAECAGGGGLLLGGLLTKLEVDAAGPLGLPLAGVLTAASAAALAALTVAVTPANVYMYTHGATMAGLGPADAGPLALSYHYARFGVQVALVSLLSTLARDALFYAWGDQLD